MHAPRVSVLDLAPVASGSSVGEALRNSLDLVAVVESLGYQRYWVAEHHNMPGIASSSPAVLLAHLAMATTSIRLGSGGVMLPNHAPLAVAEQFGMLEELHRGRIDLGIGRAPGSDPLTARALRGDRLAESDDFLARLGELLGFFSGVFPAGHPYARITAVPGAGAGPGMWMLGSSDFGAQVAGQLGWPFSFAHHFGTGGTEAALDAYRRSFVPSATLQEPYAMIGVQAVCAESERVAHELAMPAALGFLRLRQGRPGRTPTPEETAAHRFTADEEQFIESRLRNAVIGSPEHVRAGLDELVGRYGVNELMVTTSTYRHVDRVASFTLIADACGLRPEQWVDPMDAPVAGR